MFKERLITNEFIAYFKVELRILMEQSLMCDCNYPEEFTNELKCCISTGLLIKVQSQVIYICQFRTLKAEVSRDEGNEINFKNKYLFKRDL